MNKNQFVYINECLERRKDGDGGDSYSDALVMSWQTDVDNKVYIKGQTVVNNAPYNYTVDWGDGTTENITDHNEYSHTYDTPGIYDVSITGDLPGFSVGTGRTNLLEIKSWGIHKYISLNGAFYGTSGLKKIAPNHDFTELQYSYGLFNGADLSEQENDIVFYMPKIVNCQNLFNNTKLNKNIEIIAQNCNNFSNLLSYNKVIDDKIIKIVNGPDVNTSFSFMFSGCDLFNGTLLTSFPKKVTNHKYMFNNAKKFNKPLPIDIENSTDISNLLSYTYEFNQPIDLTCKVATDASNFLVSINNLDYDINLTFEQNTTFYNTIFNNKSIKGNITLNIPGYVSLRYAMPQNTFDVNSYNKININSGPHLSSIEKMMRGSDGYNEVNITDTTGITNAMEAFNFNSKSDFVLNFTLPNVTNTSYMFDSSTLYTGTFIPPKIINGKNMFNRTMINFEIISDFTEVTDLSSFLNPQDINNGFSPENYSKLLIRLDNDGVSNITLGAINVKYDATGETARANLITKGWTITDGGLA